MCDLDYGYMGFTRNIIKIKGKTVQYDDMSIESACENENNVLLLKGKYNETHGITLPNGVKNTIENGVYIQKVGKIVFDGSNDEVWNLSESGKYIETIIMNTLKKEGSGIASNMPKKSWSFSEISPPFGFMITGNPTIRICTKEGGITSKNEALSWLALNPVTIWYELATPITESLSTEIQLPHPLRSLPNGVCDEVVGNKLIQRVGKIIVDGTNNITISEVRDNTIRFFIKESTIKNTSVSDLPFLCDSLPKTGSIWKYDVEGIYQDSYGYRFVASISISKLTGTTVNDIKAYFTANPMTLYYEVATPIEHTIDVNIKKIKKSKCYNNIKPTII